MFILDPKQSYNKKKIENIKKKTKPVDALPLFEFMMDKKGKLTKEEKDGFLNSMHESFEDVGNMLLDRAFTDGFMTENEFKDIQKKYSLTISDFATILQAHYNRKDGEFDKTGKVCLMTMEDSDIYKHKEFVKKRFDVDVMSCKEFIDKIPPEEMKKIEEIMKKEDETRKDNH